MDYNRYDIFISYRRDGGAQYARILKAELEKRGYRDRVFLDYDELKDGRFDSRIMAAIDSAPIFVFILSPNSLDRCINEDDWVRQEIIYALKHERHIIPINFDGRFTGFPHQTPIEVRNALGQHQFTKIDSESLLNVSIEKLIQDRLAPIVSPRESAHQPSVGAEIVIIPDADCRVMRFNRHLATAKADTETSIRLSKGNHLLEFVSIQCPEVTEKMKYSIPDNDYSDFIEIRLKDRVREQNATNELRRHFNDEVNKWGYIDESGKVVIPYIYLEANDFHEGVAQVMQEWKYGYIDTGGNLTIPCIYEKADDFHEGVASVVMGDKWGYIDKTGKLVIPFIYQFADRFYNGIALVAVDSKFGFIDKTGKLIIPCIYQSASPFYNRDYARVITEDGKQITIDKSGRVIER